MGGMFGGGSRVRPPAVQRASPPPTVTTESEDSAMRRAGQAGGYESTRITGDLVPPTRRRTTLG